MGDGGIGVFGEGRWGAGLGLDADVRVEYVLPPDFMNKPESDLVDVSDAEYASLTFNGVV